MNKIILVGRLSKEPEMRVVGANQTPNCNFSIAVNRKQKDASGNYPADFFNCVAWSKTAQFIGTYFHKGNRIAITGNLQNRNYTNNQGQKVYVTEVIVEEAEFVDSKNETQQSQPAPAPAPSAPAYPDPAPLAPDMNDAAPDDFFTVPVRKKNEIPEELPFEI